MSSKKKKTKAARAITIEMDSAHLEPVLNLIERGRMIPIRSRNARQALRLRHFGARTASAQS